MVFSSTFAQIHNGQIKYTVQLLENENTKFNSTIDDFLNSTKKGLSALEFTLEFNKDFSSFTHDYTGIIDEEKEIALIYSNAENSVITDLNNKMNYFIISESILFKKNEFVLYRPVYNTWELTNRFKLINNYKCYEARLTIDKSVMKTKKDKIIIAWFTSVIPMSLGPNGYSGLPGLILELQDNNVVFRANKIVLNNHEIYDLVIPSKGEQIDFNSYNIIMEDRINNVEKF